MHKPTGKNKGQIYPQLHMHVTSRIHTTSSRRMRPNRVIPTLPPSSLQARYRRTHLVTTMSQLTIRRQSWLLTNDLNIDMTWSNHMWLPSKFNWGSNSFEGTESIQLTHQTDWFECLAADCPQHPFELSRNIKPNQQKPRNHQRDIWYTKSFNLGHHKWKVSIQTDSI